MAVPTALMALVASFALASAAVLSSVDAQSGTKRDWNAKNAIAAADAGASVALLRLNRFQGSITEATPCIGPNGEIQSETGAGWCPVTTSQSVGGSSFSYQVSAYKKGSELSVVATGTAGTVSRRVAVGLLSVSGKNVFEDEHVIGQDDIVMGGDVVVKTDIGTNGNIEKNGKGAGSICGDVRHGIGKPTYPQPDCGGEVSEGNKDLPPIVPPTEIATKNSNCRLTLTCVKPSEADTYVKQGKGRTSTEPWDSKTSTINIPSNATFTMGGADYYVCGLYVKGALIMASGANVRIFIKPPGECGMSPGAVQLEVTASGVISSTGFVPSEGKYNVPGIYMLGDGEVKLGGNSGPSEKQTSINELVLYAPNSKVNISGGATWIGMIAAKSLNLQGNPLIKSEPGMVPPEITLQGLWQRTHYVECTGAAVPSPNASC
jgi:hypothetical protein